MLTCEHFPYVGGAILPETLVIETINLTIKSTVTSQSTTHGSKQTIMDFQKPKHAVTMINIGRQQQMTHLCDLPRFVVTTEDGYTIWESHLPQQDRVRRFRLRTDCFVTDEVEIQGFLLCDGQRVDHVCVVDMCR